VETATADAIDAALNQAMAAYFENCRRRIPVFIRQHFHYPGAWHTNKHALGLDILRAPFNLMWAPIYLSVQLLAIGARKLGAKKLSEFLRKIPSGFTTDVQRYLTGKALTQLLGRDPINEESDALFIQLRTSLQSVITDGQEIPASKLQSFNLTVHDALAQYRITRTASADIGNALFSTLIGGFAFQKFTPGAIAIGLAIAAWCAHYFAVDNFILGRWLGALYYGLFPPSPSLTLSLSAITLAMSMLAVAATFSGLITDPLQGWLGLHRRRLNTMIDKLEKDLSENKIGGYRPKDQFIARVLDIIDALKAYI